MFAKMLKRKFLFKLTLHKLYLLKGPEVGCPLTIIPPPAKYPKPIKFPGYYRTFHSGPIGNNKDLAFTNS
jgi:hypothetical protein